MVLGLDVGSCYTKGALFDGVMIHKSVVRTAYNPKHAITQVLADLTGYERIAATGFGRGIVPDAAIAITEITAFARGAYFLDPSVKTIIDIGGQDSKIIRVNDGHVDRFVMNDRCAAGTGNFIEKIALSLDLTLAQFGERAQQSRKPITIDSLCVVMAESEILSLVSEGEKVDDIVAGVCDSLIRRVLHIGSQIGIEEPILFCGGGALNPGLVQSLKRTHGNIIVPESAQFIGALGAALSL